MMNVNIKFVRFGWKSGGLLLEVIIALALGIVFAVAIVKMGLGTFESVRQSRDQLVAAHFAAEGIEAVRILARQDFNLMQEGTYGIEYTTSYGFNGTNNTFEKYTRTITISPTYRDDTDQLFFSVVAGGWKEPQAYLVDSTVTWLDSGRQRSVNSQALVTKWYSFPMQVFEVQTGGTYTGTEWSGDAIVMQGTATGTYISGVINGGTAADWKKLTWQGEGGIIRMQIRTSSDEATLPAAVWFGPLGLTESYFMVSGWPIQPFSGADGTQWLQVKAILGQTGGTLPAIQSISVHLK